MATKRALTRMAVAVVAAALTQGFLASPVLAEGEPDCVCIVAGGTAGMVTGATGWVKLNGDVGLVDAKMNAPLSVGSVMRTGTAGSATATVGASCSVSVAALSQMSISALADGRMCVRVTQDATTGALKGDGSSGAALAVGGAVLAATVVVVGLGQDAPVSQ